MALQLKSLRKAAGMTQGELAQRLGVDISTVGNWERGKTQMDVAQLCAVVDLLGCTPNDVLGWWDDHPRTPASDFADERQGAMNKAFEALSDDGKTAALGAVSGIQVAERSREALQGDGAAEPQGVRADIRRTA